MIAAVEPKLLDSERDLMLDFVAESRKPRLRSMLEFAEDEVIIPEGPEVNTKFRRTTQPFSAMLLNEFDSGRWRRFAITGCVQSGKTFTALVIPLLYFAFEVEEPRIIIGVPQMQTAEDKWEKEFLPAIKAVPKFRALLPDKGRGSKGGKFDSITLKNDVTIKFMSGFGKDETRSGYTARVALLTEVDKYDRAGEASRETDPITQIESRTRAFSDSAMIFLECTVSHTKGRIWQEYTSGSQAKIVTQCPECGCWEQIKREDFRGFKEAKNELEAENSKFFCPKCDHKYTERERKAANLNGLVLHGDQKIDDGRVVGDLPPTRTMGFRWDAWNNLFWKSSFLGLQEYNEYNGLGDEESAKDGAQFRWTTPWSDGDEVIELKPEHIERQVSKYGKGFIPDGTSFVTLGVDVNKAVLHWSAIAWNLSGSCHVIDYGKKATQWKLYGEDLGYVRALRYIHDEVMQTWECPDYLAAAVDSRYQPDMVYDAIRGLEDSRWYMFFGCGSGNMEKVKYSTPKNYGKSIVKVGRRCHLYVDGVKYQGLRCISADANEWKTEFQERVSRGSDEYKGSGGTLQLFSSSNEKEHHTISRHITAETLEEKFLARLGLKRVWVTKRKENHWLDSLYMQFPLAMLIGDFKFKQIEIQSLDTVL